MVACGWWVVCETDEYGFGLHFGRFGGVLCVGCDVVYYWCGVVMEWCVFGVVMTSGNMLCIFTLHVFPHFVCVVCLCHIVAVWWTEWSGLGILVVNCVCIFYMG